MSGPTRFPGVPAPLWLRVVSGPVDNVSSYLTHPIPSHPSPCLLDTTLLEAPDHTSRHRQFLACPDRQILMVIHETHVQTYTIS